MTPQHLCEASGVVAPHRTLLVHGLHIPGKRLRNRLEVAVWNQAEQARVGGERRRVTSTRAKTRERLIIFSKIPLDNRKRRRGGGLPIRTAEVIRKDRACGRWRQPRQKREGLMRARVGGHAAGEIFSLRQRQRALCSAALRSGLKPDSRCPTVNTK